MFTKYENTFVKSIRTYVIHLLINFKRLCIKLVHNGEVMSVYVSQLQNFSKNFHTIWFYESH